MMKTKPYARGAAALLLVLAFLASALMLAIPKAAGASAQTVGKIFYYVDAGNLAENADGTGAKGDRGTTGYPSIVRTLFMQEHSLSFGASAVIGENQLYNSATDKEVGEDAVTGKTWGFESYGDCNTWRYGKTASKADGFDTVRHTNEKTTDDVVLKYTFEVDDAATALKIKLGTRTMSGWGDKGKFDVAVNGVAAAQASSKEADQTFEYDANGVEKDGKFFVDLTLGTIDQEVFICWILVTTDDYVLPEAGEVYTFNQFVKRGGVPTAQNSKNETVDSVLSADDRAKVDGAPVLRNVTVSPTIGEEAFANTTVTVLPKETAFFVNVAGGDAQHVNGDKAYAEGSYGYVGEAGTAAWDTSGFEQSCRYNDKGTKKLVYQFDIANGVYGLRLGSYGQWDQARSMYVTVNGGSKIDFNAVASAASSTVVEGVKITDGSLTLEFGNNGSDPLLTYILIYKMNTVTYDVQGGNALDPDYFEDGTQLDIVKAGVRTGYTFDGWFDSASGGNAVSEATADTTVFARWTPKTYTVVLNKAGGDFGEGNDSVSLTTATAVAGLPAAGTKTGYTFDGWYTAAAGGDKVANGDAWAYDITNLYARFTAKTYTVTLDYNDAGATAAGSVTATYGSEITLPDSTSAIGEFVGWFTAAEGGVKITDGDIWSTDSDTTLFAHYIIPVEITVTLVYGNGTADGSITVVYNEAVAGLPETAVKNGYDFDGWYTLAEGGKKYANGDLWKEDGITKLYAQYTAATYQITYQLGGGTAAADSPATYVFGQGAALKNPTKAGYVFEGWYSEAELINKVTSLSATDFGDKTLYAKWSAAKWTVSFDSKGGSTVAPIADVENGSKIQKPADPTKEGYNFKGWYADSACLVRFDFADAEITEDLTLYAGWEEAPKTDKKNCKSFISSESSGFFLGGGLLVLAAALLMVLMPLKKKRANKK